MKTPAKLPMKTPAKLPMKTPAKLLVLALLLTLGTSGAEAASKKKSKKATDAGAQATASQAAAASKKNSRDIRFNGSNVDGKYLSAGETIAEVEGEKQMGALIGIRKNFRDKLNAENSELAKGQ